jgi:transposase
MDIQTVGIDLAKNMFQIHGMNERGKPILRKQLKRDQVVVFCANLSPCLIGMEACGSAHDRARKFEARGHTCDSWPRNSSNPMSIATRMMQQMPRQS